MSGIPRRAGGYEDRRPGFSRPGEPRLYRDVDRRPSDVDLRRPPLREGPRRIGVVGRNGSGVQISQRETDAAVLLPGGRGRLLGDREDLRREELRREELRREELRKEELRREEQLRREELRQIELRQLELRKEELRREELRREDLRRQEMRRDDPRRVDLHGEDLRREDLRRETLHGDDLRREELRREELRRELLERDGRERLIGGALDVGAYNYGKVNPARDPPPPSPPPRKAGLESDRTYVERRSGAYLDRGRGFESGAALVDRGSGPHDVRGRGSYIERTNGSYVDQGSGPYVERKNVAYAERTVNGYDQRGESPYNGQYRGTPGETARINSNVAEYSVPRESIDRTSAYGNYETQASLTYPRRTNQDYEDLELERKRLADAREGGRLRDSSAGPMSVRDLRRIETLRYDISGRAGNVGSLTNDSANAYIRPREDDFGGSKIRTNLNDPELYQRPIRREVEQRANGEPLDRMRELQRRPLSANPGDVTIELERRLNGVRPLSRDATVLERSSSDRRLDSEVVFPRGSPIIERGDVARRRLDASTALSRDISLIERSDALLRPISAVVPPRSASTLGRSILDRRPNMNGPTGDRGGDGPFRGRVLINDREPRRSRSLEGPMSWDPSRIRGPSLKEQMEELYITPKNVNRPRGRPEVQDDSDEDGNRHWGREFYDDRLDGFLGPRDWERPIDVRVQPIGIRGLPTVTRGRPSPVPSGRNNSNNFGRRYEGLRQESRGRSNKRRASNEMHYRGPPKRGRMDSRGYASNNNRNRGQRPSGNRRPVVRTPQRSLQSDVGATR